MLSRYINVVLCLLCMSAALYFLRNLLLVQAPANDVGSSFKTTATILAVLFGALAIVFAYRAISPNR